MSNTQSEPRSPYDYLVCDLPHANHLSNSPNYNGASTSQLRLLRKNHQTGYPQPCHPRAHPQILQPIDPTTHPCT
jgi:hypothetical protein